MYCTGERCPMQFGFDVKRCTLHNCSYRTKPITNGDHIRAMTDEKLTKFLCALLEDAAEFNGFDDCKLDEGKEDRMLKWLQQPAKEDNHGSSDISAGTSESTV